MVGKFPIGEISAVEGFEYQMCQDMEVHHHHYEGV